MAFSVNRGAASADNASSALLLADDLLRILDAPPDVVTAVR